MADRQVGTGRDGRVPFHAIRSEREREREPRARRSAKPLLFRIPGRDAGESALLPVSDRIGSAAAAASFLHDARPAHAREAKPARLKAGEVVDTPPLHEVPIRVDSNEWITKASVAVHPVDVVHRGGAKDARLVRIGSLARAAVERSFVDIGADADVVGADGAVVVPGVPVAVGSAVRGDEVGVSGGVLRASSAAARPDFLSDVDVVTTIERAAAVGAVGAVSVREIGPVEFSLFVELLVLRGVFEGLVDDRLVEILGIFGVLVDDRGFLGPPQGRGVRRRGEERHQEADPEDRELR